MTDIRRQVSHIVETQFPDVYMEYGAELVEFITSYYEYLESNNKYSTNRVIVNNIDVDEASSSFLTQFHEKLLKDFPFGHSTDKRFLIKHILDFYSTKGSPYSIQLLLKFLFREDSRIYYPGDDILKISDSDWYKPNYLEVTKSSRTASYLNQEITGVRSGAKAFVESIIRKRVKGKVFDVLFLSDVRGAFSANERITDNGVIARSPRVKGSLTEVDIILGGRDNSIGDIFDVVTSEGVKGKAKITEVVNATGRVDFTITDSGWGYTTGNTTNIYVSDAILFVNNTNQEFLEFEEVYQPVQKIYTTSSADITGLSGLVGQTLQGYDVTFSTLLAEGTIVAISNTAVSNGSVVVTANASANALITVMPTSGTFLDQRSLALSSNNILYTVDEIIAEESTVDLTVTNIIGTFSSGEKVNQRTYTTYGSTVTGITATLTSSLTVTVSSTTNLIAGQPLTKTAGTGAFAPRTFIRRIVSPTQLVINKLPTTTGSITFTAGTFDVLTNYAFGNYDSTSGGVITLTESWGSFNTDALIVGATSNASALPTDVYIDNANIGARGKLTSYTAGSNNIIVEMIFGSYDVGNKVRGEKSGKIYTVNTNNASGAVVVALSSNANANGVITNSTSNNITGIIIGQNTTSIGVYGNTSAFYYSNTAYDSYIKTDRRMLLSPPRYANNIIIDLSKEITRIPGGTGANFEIGVIGNVDEDVTLYTDIIGGNNIAGVPYSTIRLDGQGSGFGYVQDVTITTGGSGYTNNDVIAFEGGGFANGEPSIPASAFITTDTSGAITDITVDIPGSGYFQPPTIVLSENFAGADATVEVVMNYGYGFPKNPQAEYFNFIGDILNVTIADIGSIELLSRINPGTQYTANPYVKVYNPYVASYQRSDLVLNVINVTNGSFSIGEELTQIIDNSIFVKGIVKAVNLVAGSGQIYLKRQSIGISFAEGVQVTGGTTGARADIVDVFSDAESRFIGDNAVITGTAISANGVATKAEIISSGYGYITGDTVELEAVANDNPFIITATSRARSQGISEGYWRTTSSHLNSEKKIHDNEYYQEYSYDIVSGLSLNRYERIINRLAHVAGTKMFGSVEKNLKMVVGTKVADSSITQYVSTDAYLTTDIDTNFTINGSYLIVTTEIEADG